MTTETVTVEPGDANQGPTAEGAPTAEVPQWRLMARRFLRGRLAVISVIVLGLLYLCAIFSATLSPNEYGNGGPVAMADATADLRKSIETIANEQNLEVGFSKAVRRG